MLIGLMMHFVKPDVSVSANSGDKLLKLDFKNESNLCLRRQLKYDLVVVQN